MLYPVFNKFRRVSLLACACLLFTFAFGTAPAAAALIDGSNADDWLNAHDFILLTVESGSGGISFYDDLAADSSLTIPLIGLPLQMEIHFTSFQEVIGAPADYVEALAFDTQTQPFFGLCLLDDDNCYFTYAPTEENQRFQVIGPNSIAELAEAYTSPVPLPSALVLLATGIVGVCTVRRKRQNG